MTGPTAPATRAGSGQLPVLGLSMVHTLVLQMLLGLANTFWLALPDSGPGWDHASPAWLVYAHILLGLALLVFAARIGWLARTESDGVWGRASVLGIIGIVVAAGGGSWFMGAVDSDVASFVMALGWALALASYATALARSAQRVR